MAVDRNRSWERGNRHIGYHIALPVFVALAALAGCSGGGGGGDPAPVAVSDSYGTGAGQLTLTVNTPGVLGNDTGSGITAEQVSGPSQAQSFVLNPDGSFNYVHNNTSPATSDSFTYHVKNSAGTSASATVTINITPPVANDDNGFLINPGGTAAGNVLSNDTPSTGVTAELVGGPAYAVPGFTLNPDGSFTYIHNNNTAITDSFTYRVKVGAIISNTATVTININQPPVASNICPAIVDGATSVGITLPAIDPNGSMVGASYTIDSLPTHGTISGCSGVPCPVGYNVTYIPTSISTRRGMDKFTFHVTDSGGLPSATATAWILNNGTVRIMPLGDSITEGFTVGSSNLPATGYRIGYRKKLYDDLTGGGYPVDFVGSQIEGSSAGLVDPDHEGHPGYCAGPNGSSPTYCTTTSGNIADNVNTWLDNHPADIILLHAGTNAFTPSASDVQLLLDNINTWAAANYPVKVFVARIIQTSTLNGTASIADITLFNDNVQAIDTSAFTAVTVFSVNQQTGAGLNYTIDAGATCLGGGACSGDLGDDLHPNPSGYGKIANRWRTDLLSSNLLPSCP